MVESRTVAGPSSVVQCVLSGSRYIVSPLGRPPPRPRGLWRNSGGGRCAEFSTLSDNVRGDYVGRHRKPDHEQTDVPRESLQPRTFELFTHGTQPIHIHKEK